MDKPSFRQLATRELALFVGLLFAGFVLMPIAIYFVGQWVFGAYSGAGYGEFFGALSEKVRGGDPVAWFLVLSPWLGWQTLRAATAAWRASSA